MALTITISRGTTLPSDRPITLDDLHLLGLPTVSLTGGVGPSDISSGAVNASHVLPGGICVATATGTTTLTVTASPGPTTHAAGTWLWIVPASTTTGNVTLTINSLSSKSLRRVDGAECRPGDLVAGMPALVTYSATGGYYVLTNPAGPSVLYAVDTGTANAAVVTIPWTFANLADLVGIPITVKKMADPNTGPMTIAVNGKAATDIVTAADDPLTYGELYGGSVFVVMYDGEEFHLISGGDHTDTTAAASGTTLDWGLAHTQHRTLTGNLTYTTFSNLHDGAVVTLWVVQAASGGPYTVSWDAGLAIKWQNATAPLMATTAGRAQAYSFWRVNGVTYGAVSANHG